jgi:hypothetical protein
VLLYTAISSPIALDQFGYRIEPGTGLSPGNQAARLAAPPFRPQHQCPGTKNGTGVSLPAPSVSLNFDVQTIG